MKTVIVATLAMLALAAPALADSTTTCRTDQAGIASASSVSASRHDSAAPRRATSTAAATVCAARSAGRSESRTTRHLRRCCRISARVSYISER